ncbi:ankyrin repeat domain-containing protein [Flavobacterium bizetiae]|uniref:ankyrin repeat domain-containing protein n=1 Tax=Flavobacterium bizetiae TaxID=2704140 RepID=UPI0021E87C20|nr:ankyrin repeat domain-containing protein [Flavobacterium bizetiae]UTN03118.1 ankyrin repeat domain-containing protein [Flavobacterium bizetiae]
MKKSVIILAVALAMSTSVLNASNIRQVVKDPIDSPAYEVSSLHYAVCAGDIESVKKLIAYGANLNKVIRDMSPLMLAARFNKFEIVEILLASGANPRIENEKGLRAIHYAEYAKATESIAMLKNAK